MSPAGDLRVNGERLWQDLMAMAEIGATAGDCATHPGGEIFTPTIGFPTSGRLAIRL